MISQPQNGKELSFLKQNHILPRTVDRTPHSGFSVIAKQEIKLKFCDRHKTRKNHDGRNSILDPYTKGSPPEQWNTSDPQSSSSTPGQKPLAMVVCLRCMPSSLYNWKKGLQYRELINH